jgi:glycerol-3-phosphate responsive antiterminator
MAIVARTRVVYMMTAIGRVTGIIRTNVTIIAADGSPSTSSTATDVLGRAGVAVVARMVIVDVGAAVCGIASIVGTDVVIIAIRGCASDTDPIRTRVLRRTSIAIIAGQGIVHMNTATGRIAGIIRA